MIWGTFLGLIGNYFKALGSEHNFVCKLEVDSAGENEVYVMLDLSLTGSSKLRLIPDI